MRLAYKLPNLRCNDENQTAHPLALQKWSLGTTERAWGSGQAFCTLRTGC